MDDLFFYAIELVNYLKPKIATFENVEGLMKGQAKNYFNKIIADLHKIGYVVQVFIVDGSTLGLPQKRRRVFFICQRKDFFKRKLNLNFNEQPIPFIKIRDDSCKEHCQIPHSYFQYYINKKTGDHGLDEVMERLRNKKSFFNSRICYNNEILPTITSHSASQYILADICRTINKNELLSAGSFPKDYNFLNANVRNICYLIGMSVPPLMSYKISREIARQLF